MSLDLATLGMDWKTHLKVLRPHVFAFFRHMTAKKLVNFIRAEINRLQQKTILDSMPYILKIEPTNICNLNCGYCYDNRRQPKAEERAYGRMPFKNFKRIIDEVGPYLFKINLYGFGEPLLFPECLDMITYATRNNIGVGISSNLNFKIANLAKDIINSGLEVLIFSCHGISKDSYNQFMGKGNFELAMQNIRELIKERKRAGSRTPLIDWQFCVTRFNQHEIAQASVIAHEIGIDQIRFIRPDLPEDAEDQWFSDLFPPRAHFHHKPQNCSWVYRSAYINWDGGVLPCCRDTRRLENDFGNVFQERFATLWNNSNYISSRRLIAAPDTKIDCEIMCSKCPIIGFGHDV